MTQTHLPVLIGDPMDSVDWQKPEEASLACHEWQHGSHIDSLPKQPQGNEKMSVLDRVSLADQIAEVHREIEMRKRVYIRQVDNGKMTATEAARRSTVMAAVLETLEELRNAKRQVPEGDLPPRSLG